MPQGVLHNLYARATVAYRLTSGARAVTGCLGYRLIV